MYATPSPRYAKLAAALREPGLEVQDDDFELIDATVSACNAILDARFASGQQPAGLSPVIFVK